MGRGQKSSPSRFFALTPLFVRSHSLISCCSILDYLLEEKRRLLAVYWKLSTVVSNRGKSTCFYILIYKNTSSHYSFSIQIDGAPYFVGIVWIVDNVDSLFIRESSVGILLNIFYPLTRRMPLLKVTSACRTKCKVGIFYLI